MTIHPTLYSKYKEFIVYWYEMNPQFSRVEGTSYLALALAVPVINVIEMQLEIFGPDQSLTDSLSRVRKFYGV